MMPKMEASEDQSERVPSFKMEIEMENRSIVATKFARRVIGFIDGQYRTLY